MLMEGSDQMQDDEPSESHHTEVLTLTARAVGTRERQQVRRRFRAASRDSELGALGVELRLIRGMDGKEFWRTVVK